MHETPELHIIIIGAGLGGLAAAIACALEGHKVTVLERAPELAEIGAGLQITPNSSRILHAWGLGPDLEKCWSEPTAFSLHRYSDGKVFYLAEDWNVQMRKKYGFPFFDIHRGQLQLMMYKRALELGVDIRLGAAVSSVMHKTAQITLSTGETYQGDLVVGADGLWSVCREALLNQESTPKPTGDLAYRIIFTLDQITDPELRSWIQKPACRIWIGPRSHVVAYSMKSNSVYNVVLLVPDDLPPHVSRQEGDINEMKALFQDWDPLLTRFLDQVDSVQKWKLMSIPEMETWTNPDRNFLLMGDSCHPMLPYLAQGASSAIEDGAVLGLLLGRVKSRSQIPHFVEMWQNLRKGRGEFIKNESSAQREVHHMLNGPQQQERDSVFERYLGKEPEPGFPLRWADPKVQRILFSYDAVQEVEAALAKAEVNGGVPEEK